jgi:hypothetical protein
MKIRLLFTSTLIIVTLTSWSQNNQTVSTFANLKTMTLEGEIKIHYPEAGTEVFNIKCNQLPKDDPFYGEDDTPDGQNIKALRLKIGPSDAQAVTVLFTEGPSMDPAFIFARADGSWITNLGGLELYISGNGYVYTVGHTNTSFNKKSKYFFNGEEFKEVRQPFYYIGLVTTTTRNITIYADKNEEEAVATIPANTEVEVLLAEYSQKFGGFEYFLVKTPLGLVGWVGFQTYNLSEGTPLKGIYYSGD